MMKFPNNFMFGGATAANQYEGGYDKGGKGKTKNDYSTTGTATEPRYITYVLPDGTKGKSALFEPMPKGAVATEFEDTYYPNQIAVDFYNRYEEDIELLAELGIKIFRMSISWARIFPNGIESHPNKEGLDFYRKIFTKLQEHNIQPLVTLSHYETPSYLEEELGGWSNPKLIAHFVNYSKAVINEFKDVVNYWITFNEINYDLLMFMFTDEKNLTVEYSQNAFERLHNMFLASAKTVIEAKKIDSTCQIGAMVAGAVTYPLTPDPEDIILNQKHIQKYVYYCGDVMVRGKYASFSKDIWASYGVNLTITEEDKEILREGKVDFYSFSYYGSACTTVHKEMAEEGKGNFQVGIKNPYLKESEWGWPIDGLGLRYHLNELYDRYEIPLMVVENGLGYDDILEEDGSIHDDYRISYMEENIKGMLGAIYDGVDLLAYTSWGIIDLISASTGEMKKRYGVIYVDLDDKGIGTRNRYKKDSYYWYQELIATNGQNLY